MYLRQRVLEQEREAAELGLNSVPSVIVGNHMIPGAVRYETLVRAVRMVPEFQRNEQAAPGG